MTGTIRVLLILCGGTFHASSVAQPKEDIRDAIPILGPHAGQIFWAVGMCGELHSERKAEYVTAYQKVRAENLDLFVPAEKLESYSATIAALRQQYLNVSREGREVVCAEVLKEIESLSKMLKELRG